MKQSTFYYLLRRGLFKSAMSVAREGLVMFNKFTTAGISHPAQGSAEFDGSSDYITTPNISIQSSTTWTIGVWIYNNNHSSGYLFDGREGSSDGFGFYEASSNNWNYYDNSGSHITTSGVFGNDEWYYLNIVRDGSSSIKIYKDGSLTDTLTSSSTYDVSGDFYIGTRFTIVNFFDGNLANFAAWNRALSSDEINAVMWKGYQSLTDNEKSGLQAWYSLDDVASPAASLATMEALAVDKDATIENKAAVTAAINALS